MTQDWKFCVKMLFLILTVVPCCRSLQVSIPSELYKATQGEDITLTCSFIPGRPDYSMLMLSWEILPNSNNEPVKSVAMFFLNNPVDIAPPYEGRATLTVDVHKQVSTLQLRKLTTEDSRTYQCSVKIPDDDEGTTAATTSLLVLAPPSKPVCGVQGKAEYWQDISLTCMSEEGSPKPDYKWQSYTVNNIPRKFPPKTTEKDGILSLVNISMETSGFWICTSTNQVGSESCNLTLAVMPPNMNMGASAGIIAGVIIGILLLGIVIYCCCRKKNKKNTYTEGSPEAVEFHHKDAPEAEEQYSDDKSSNDIKQGQKDVLRKANYCDDRETAGRKFEDDQDSYDSSKDRLGCKGSETETRHYKDEPHDSEQGGRNHFDQHEHYGSSQDRRDDYRDRYSDSRERLDNQRERSGSRDRLDDQRNHYSGSRDRLDDQRNHYSGSHGRYDDRRDRYGGSRERLDDNNDCYRTSRDNLNDHRARYGGSRDRLDDHHDRYRSQYE
ncbi:cell surface A33 antigen-like [Thalassophryne amazonica]|uniref:cell surface A33 antigen-like n=1 Tax=Thalassophryne amazonica TaxID=390379 RepID=UPI001471AB60|nr:cell surface A33 antigen-like [Thalassophryne amazonica]XP_034041754.1 cell surface A33 antigen-like [Thalassophryne amazonica]